LERVRSQLKSNCDNVANEKDVKFLEEFIRGRIKHALKLFKDNDKQNKQKCTFEKLHQVLRDMRIPERFLEEKMVKAVFNEHNDNTEFNYVDFIEKLSYVKEDCEFFNYKMRNLENLQHKVNTERAHLNDLIQENEDVLLRQRDKFKSIENGYVQAIEEKSHKNVEKPVRIPSSMQPSAEYSNKVFSNSSYYFYKHKEIENTFSPDILAIKMARPKTRYGANPSHKNTFVNFQGENDPEAFKKNRCLSGCLFPRKKDNFEMKNKRIQEYNNEVREQTIYKDFINEERKINSKIKSTELLYNHEKINFLRSDHLDC